MKYLSRYTIYNEVIDGMKAMGISRDELAANLQMTLEELDALLNLLVTTRYLKSDISSAASILTSVLTLYLNDSYIRL